MIPFFIGVIVGILATKFIYWRAERTYRLRDSDRRIWEDDL